jgi:UDP-N-acetylmuramoyl-L-alanyl-D-glutamate--2,6-diaminopimelate ligase
VGTAGVLRPRSTRPVTLSDLSSLLGLQRIGPDASVTGVALSSAAVVPGDLFVAIRGVNRHGSDFWPDAAAAGARAVWTDDEGVLALGNPELPTLVAENPRLLLGLVAQAVYQTQGETMPTIWGVTGTNGKTSSAFLLEALWRGMGEKTALSTTALRQVNALGFPSTLTTPEAPDIHAMIARAAEEGVTGVALEISAQALDKNRMDQVVCDVAGFTNLSHDHFEDFGGMENYLAAKAVLFTPEHATRAVICTDSTWGDTLTSLVSIPFVTLAQQGHADTDWTYQVVESTDQGTVVDVLSRQGAQVRLAVPVRGLHMVANTALAVAMIVESGVSPERFSTMAPGTSGVPVFIPGRMERVSGDRGPQVYVDAGRSADAYLQTLTSLRQLTRGSLMMVCGTSGNRDATKRPMMGRTAAELADVVIITDDDPRREDPVVIRQGLLEGARSVEGSLVHEVPDPSDAIRFAIGMAGEGDTILWSGPGSQDYRDIGGTKVPYSARGEARAALREAGWGDDG